MGQTPNYAIPYPECDPPLRKDAADAADFRDLAEAADAAMDVVYDQAFDWVFTPDLVRMATAAAVVTTGQTQVPFLNSATYNPSGMADVVNGVIRILEPGRYFCGTFTSATAVALDVLRTRFMIDGAPASNFQTPGQIVQLNTLAASAQAVLSFTEPANLNVQIRHSASAALSFSYTTSVWAVQWEKF